MMSTITKAPRLWRIRDPRRLVSMGQMELPGMKIENPKTSEQAWAELESADPKLTSEVNNERC